MLFTESDTRRVRFTTLEVEAKAKTIHAEHFRIQRYFILGGVSSPGTVGR